MGGCISVSKGDRCPWYAPSLLPPVSNALVKPVDLALLMASHESNERYLDSCRRADKNLA